MKHTPGPWRWEISEQNKRIQLCGGKPHFDLTVMDFERWGMQNATPRFIEPNNEGLQLLYPASKYAEVVPGREHHAHWFKCINNPDAKLIAAAPDLLNALENLVIGFGMGWDLDGMIEVAQDAIKKATT